MNMPLRIAFLWHLHQPYYRKGNHFILPWVRLHAAKDYRDLPALAEHFPALKQTINVVPSLLVQLDEYVRYGITDTIQELTMVDATLLNNSQKQDILHLFFLCNYEHMIAPYPRYNELYLIAKHEKEQALEMFSAQDWRDLQTWYNLSWIGELYTIESEEVKNLYSNDHFSEQDKHRVLAIHIQIIEEIIPIIKKAVQDKRLEISVTPFYHPIIPLLIDVESAKESLPTIELPEYAPNSIEDAEYQIVKALTYCKDRLDIIPNGMWPSEGSVSNKALDIFAKNAVSWIATDEQILFSTPGTHHHLDKYFPRKIRDIVCFFRDHSLSDAIGFEYASWEPEKAARNFIEKLLSIRQDIIEYHGEKALEYAVVPVILDGENCWEFYQENGVPFLKKLYTFLTSHEHIQTITMSEGLNGSDFLPPLTTIQAGSWIHANFTIWIGHPEDNAAWDMIGNARSALFSSELQPKSPEWLKAYNHILIAEGSDWFWWYGDDHNSANQTEFDELFRWNIEQVYTLIGVDIPMYVKESILGMSKTILPLNQKTLLHTLFQAEYSGSATHSVTELLKYVSMYQGNSQDPHIIEIHTHKGLNAVTDMMIIRINYNHNQECSIIWKDQHLHFDGYIPKHCGRGLHHIYFSLPDTLQSFHIQIETTTKSSRLSYPRIGGFISVTV